MYRMIKVIFCDLDDTLLTPITKEISNEDIEAIHRWLSQGNDFVIATARHHSFLRKTTHVMDDFDCIGWNGAEIYLKHKTVQLLPFQNEQVLEIYENMKQYKTYAKVTNIHNEYIFGSMDFYNKDIFQDEFCTILNKDIDHYLNRNSLPIVHINYIFPTTQLHYQFYKDYQNNKNINKQLYSCKITSKFSFDITVKQATKEDGIQTYLQYIDIPIHQIATIGDSLNDIGMFKLTKYSFCMSHGHEEAKKKANYVVKSVSEAIRILERKNNYGK